MGRMYVYSVCMIIHTVLCMKVTSYIRNPTPDTSNLAWKVLTICHWEFQRSTRIFSFVVSFLCAEQSFYLLCYHARRSPP